MRTAAIILAASTLILAACGKAGVAGHGSDGGHQMPAMPVGVASPIERQLPALREITGRIDAVETVELKPEVSGRVIKVHARDGAEIKAGDVVIEIDAEQLKATAASREAELARTDARLQQAKQQHDRGQRLVAEKVLPQQDFDDLVSALRGAEAERAVAKADLDLATLDVKRTRVVSPISGQIGKIQATVGNLVQGGGAAPATTIATIVSVDPVEVITAVDEAQWRVLGVPMRDAAVGGKVPVRIGIAGEEGHPHEGTIHFVDNRIDPVSGTIRLRARVPNPKRVLTPGAFARVQIQVAPPRPVVLVHERVVLSQLDSRYVVVVDEKNIVGFRPVRLGDRVGQLRVVEDGVKPGDRLMVTSLAKVGLFIRPGMPVAPMPADMETLQVQGPPAEAGGAPGSATAAPAQPGGDAAPAAGGGH